MPVDSEVQVVRDGRVLRVTIHRPDKHNALSQPVLASLRSAFGEAAQDADLCCVMLRGAGSRYFAAGGDLRELADVRTEHATRAMATESRAALDAIRDFPVPVVAVLNGDAIGGGAELAVACDFRVMREGASLGFIHGKLNITSAWGGGPDLVSLVGPARALYMTARCAMISAPSALAWGLADALVRDDALEEDVAEFIKPMLHQSPRALRAGKDQVRCFRRGASYEERRAAEHENFVVTWLDPAHWVAAERLLAPREIKR
jgi:enoyl-CoA hydratase/carnithine racemase